jgi:hypothetical protein
LMISGRVPKSVRIVLILLLLAPDFIAIASLSTSKSRDYYILRGCMLIPPDLNQHIAPIIM